MTRTQRFHLIGLAATIVIVICGQLMWLPGGTVYGNGLFWIDLLDALLYVLLLPPLFWLLARFPPRMQPPALITHAAARFTIAAVRFAIAVGCVWLAVEIIPVRRDWIRIVSLFAGLAVLVPADIILDELVRKRRLTRGVSASLGAILLAAVLLLAPTPYDVTYPGLAMNMHRYARIEPIAVGTKESMPGGRDISVADQTGGGRAAGGPAESQGAMIGLLVFQRPAVPADWLYAAAFPHYDFRRRSPDDRSLPEQLHIAHTMKSGADAAAAKAAMARLGAESASKLRIAYHRYALHEGGPSHGAMLALTIIDQLTPGGIANGWRVAGTGTIDGEGAIGAIGGIRQKAYTASKAGAEVFFVPASQEHELRGAAGDMEIVGVNTIDEMLLWLKRHEKKPHLPK